MPAVSRDDRPTMELAPIELEALLLESVAGEPDASTTAMVPLPPVAFARGSEGLPPTPTEPASQIPGPRKRRLTEPGH